MTDPTAALRDRIADALLTTRRTDWEGKADHRQHRYDARCALCAYDVDALTTAVLAVLPEPTGRADALTDAADRLGRMDYDTDSNDYGYDTYRDAWNGGVMDAAGELRRLAAEAQQQEPDGARQQPDTEAHPPTVTWKVESPRRDKWASWGGTYDDESDWVRESYETSVRTAPGRPFRMVRATTTYTVEAEHTPAAPMEPAAADGKETRTLLHCNWAHTLHEHTPHDWAPQPGMEPVHCPGYSN